MRASVCSTDVELLLATPVSPDSTPCDPSAMVDAPYVLSYRRAANIYELLDANAPKPRPVDCVVSFRAIAEHMSVSPTTQIGLDMGAHDSGLPLFALNDAHSHR